MHLQLSDLAVRQLPDAVQPPPVLPDLLDAMQVPAPRRHDVAGPSAPARQQRVDDAAGGERERLRHDPDQMEPPVARQHRANAVPLKLQPVVRDRSRTVGGLHVANDRGGYSDDPSPGDLRPPRQVEVLAEEVHGRVEAAEDREQVGSDERASAGRAEHVPHRIVLFLVEFAPLDDRRAHTGLVRGLADGEQAAGVVPLDHLGRGDPRVGPERLLHHRPDRRRRQCDVVVAERVERRALDDFEHLVGGRAEAGVVLEQADVHVGIHGRHPLRDAVLAGRRGVAIGVDDQDRQVRVVLGGERLQALLEPWRRLVRHHHGHDRRRRDRRFLVLFRLVGSVDGRDRLGDGNHGGRRT